MISHAANPTQISYTREVTKRVAAKCLAAFLLLASADSFALYLNRYQANVNARFYTGADRAFIGDGLDWSGVNNGPSWATMISPTYFLSAGHLHPGAGTQLNFYSGNDLSAAPETHLVDNFGFQTSLNGKSSDVWLGRLTTPVSSSIAKYPILELPSESDYIGQSLFVYGHGARYGAGNLVGLNKISVVDTLYFNTRESEFFFDGKSGPSTSALIGGDSGGPSFVEYAGKLALVGIHYWTCGTYVGACQGDSFVPFYSDQIAAAMGSERFTSVGAVPEPATWVLALTSLAMVGRISLQRRQNA
ncbi:MAG: trypsin-like serine protease [Methylococcaceae bacterium]|nr:trypsin-like serine protease [Methylococcaceae bacterium]